MLKQISWVEYFITIIILLAVYYLAIFIIYYRDDFRKMLNNKKRLSPEVFSIERNQLAINQNDTQNNGQPSQNTEMGKFYDVVDHIIPELKKVFQKDYVKEELVLAIQQQLKDYSHLKGSAFQVAVNNFIRLEAEKNCSITFEEDEASVLWS